MKYKLKVFLAALALAFALQVTLGLNDSYDPVGKTVIRIFIGSLVAGAFTFFWAEFKNWRQKEKH